MAGVLVSGLAHGAFLPAMTRTFVNSAAIAVEDDGPASPYPSSLTVTGLTGVVTRVSVQLRGVTHPYPDDLDVLLVPPAGSPVWLMSDAGGSFPLNGVTVSIEDGAAAVPNSGQIGAGPYGPANWGLTADGMPSPAPPGPYLVGLTNLGGINPNGLWRLFVFDDALDSVGTINGGWSLTVTAAEFVPELNVVRMGAAIQLSWSTAAAGFSLEGGTGLGNAPGWSAVTNAVVVTNGQNRVTVPALEAARFFRLRK